MIKISLYDNGFEINGHAEQHICSEVSILAWACANSICHVDETSDYYSSCNDNPTNPQEGRTYMTFDTSNEKAKWVFDEYKHNLNIWAKDMWKDTAVQIESKPQILVVTQGM